VNRLRFERDNIVNYSHEVTRLEKVCSEEDQEIDNLEHVLTILERYERHPLSKRIQNFFLGVIFIRKKSNDIQDVYNIVYRQS